MLQGGHERLTDRQTDRQTGWIQYTPTNFVAGGINIQKLPFNNSICHIPFTLVVKSSLRWRHNGRNSISNHQPDNCFLNRLFRHRSKKTSKLHVTGLGVGNSPEASEFPAQMASYAENVSIWWRHHGLSKLAYWDIITAWFSQLDVLYILGIARIVKRSYFEVTKHTPYSMVSCQKGPTRHAYAWQIGPFWQ